MGVKYAIGNVSVSAAYEHNNDQDSAPSDIDQYFVGVTGTTTINETHDAEKPVGLVMIKDGKKTYVGSITPEL